jgi:hypothetical protein
MDPNDNPYESVVESDEFSDLRKLSGIRSMAMESKGTPTVHKSRDVVGNISESHHNAISSYMVSYARHRALVESVSDIDLDAATRRFANTVLLHPKASVGKVLQAVAEKTAKGNEGALHEHITNTFGLRLEDFQKAIVEDQRLSYPLTKQTIDRVLDLTETYWNVDCPDKGQAFIRALNAR